MRPLLISFVLALSLSMASAQVLSVATLAGSTDGGGYADGPGKIARFSDPTDVAVDSFGNIFVADSSNRVIRKITPAGDVTTFAGTADLPGGADGKPGAFSRPAAVAVDRATNEIYVADVTTIRRITADGVVSTVAGTSGLFGTADGTGSLARFASPQALAVAPDGTIYVADTHNSTIRKVTRAGVVTTLAGVARDEEATDGSGANAKFSEPQGIAVDASAGTIYVADTGNGLIRKVTPDGNVTTLARQSGDIFFTAYGIAVDAGGEIVFSDPYYGRICKITPAGVVTAIAGAIALGSADGNGASARFNTPTGLAFDAAGDLYIADQANEAIRRMAPSRDVTTFAGLAPSAAAFTFPRGVAVDAAGNTYVIDDTSVVKKITPAGAVTTLAGLANATGAQDGTGSAARFNRPWGIAVDRRDGSVIVADLGNSTIRRITAQGVVTTVAAAFTFKAPRCVAVDGSGNIYVGDVARIYKIAPDGTVTGVAKNATSSIDAVAVDAAGTVYAIQNGKIYELMPDGSLRNYAGGGGGFGEGQGNIASFEDPHGLTIDAGGNVYVADTGNHVIRRVAPPLAIVTTIGGAPVQSGNVNGPGIAARFSSPSAIAITPGGQLVIADTNNHAIRIATLVPTVRVRAVRH